LLKYRIFLGGKSNLNNRLVSLVLVFALLFTIFVPFVQKVDAQESSITFLPAESTDEGIQLQWKTVTASPDEEVFVVEKNNEELSTETMKQLDSVENQQNEIERTYQLLDTDVVDEEYTYTVKKAGEPSLQTEPISVTYKQDVQELTLHITNITENSMTVSWSDVQQADSYHLVVNGKVVDQFEKATPYELEGLTSGTSYSVSVRAIQNEKILTEATQTVKTKAAEVQEEQESTSDETKTQAAAQNSSKEIKIAASEAVSIPDLALKRLIKRQLGIQSDEITVADMEGLTELNASYQNIKNINGLEKAVNLTKLELAGNEIKTADPLINLTKLEYIDMSYFLGSKVDFLSKLTNLKTLILTDSPVQNIDSISGLSKLETLDISFTGVTDITPLAGLKSLKDVNISYLELASIMPLKDLSLTTLTMYGDLYFLLKDEVSFLEQENIEILHDDYFKIYFSSIKVNENRAIIEWEYEGQEEVDKYQIKLDDKVATISSNETTYTINELAANTEYKVQLVAYNSKGELIGQATESFQTLSNATGEKVIFKDAQLEKAIKNEFGLERDIVESDMKHLKELSLERKRITDLTGLETATNLEYLYLSANKISNINPLASLKNLEYLYLDGNPISDFSPLSGLTNLVSLGLGNTGVKDLAFLSNLQRLEDLSLENNELDSLNSLPVLGQVAYLSVYDNKLTSLKGIERLGNLTSLFADENPITSLDDLGQLPNVRDINLSYTLLENIDRLIDFSNLDYVSLYGIDLAGNFSAMKVIELLEQRGVYVEYENSEEEEWFDVYVEAMTENSMQLYIDYYGEKEISTYEIFLNGKLINTLPAEETFLHVKELTSNTEYEIEVHAYNAQKELLFSSTVSATTWDEPTGIVIPFKDQTLEELIKTELGLERDIQESDMEHLDFLYLFEENIEDLSGLEYATNLYEFHVFGNVSELDLAPLAQLQELYYLSIEATPIKDYSVLKSMKNLQSLSIIHHQLEDLSFLEGMKNLSDITLQNNGIQDISAFSALTKLNFISLVNNHITDLTPLLATKDQLYALDLTGNPIEDISALAQFENVFDLILDETNVKDVAPLLEMYSLQFVSLYGVPLDDEALKVIEELREYGVQVNLEVDNTPDLYIDDVTDTSISISWDPMLPKDIDTDDGVYKVSLYANYGEELVQEAELTGDETSYQFSELKPNTDYQVEIMVESEEYYGYLFAEITTLPVEGSVKDVSLYAYKTADEPEVDIAFDLYGIDPETEEQYFYVLSDEDCRLWYHTGEEAVDLFTLPVGKYEIVFVTAEGEIVAFQFEIAADDDYTINPIFFVLDEEGGEQPPTVPNDHKQDQDGQDEDKEQDKELDKNQDNAPAQPIKVSKPSQSEKEKIEKKKKESTIQQKKELPQTATMTHNLLLIGVMLLVFGGVILLIQKRKRA